jgi:N-acetylglucosaminyl-diphospho-decaprenol L-rhamnosyltransferase
MKPAQELEASGGATAAGGPRGNAAAELSVVIVTYESAGCISACLEAVQRQLAGCEVIVVDNDSSDRTLDVVRGFAGARTIRSPANLGFGQACNAGARAATRSHILFLNPDVTITAVDEAALAPLLGARPFGIAAPLLGASTEELAPQIYPDRHALLDHLRLLLAPLWPREWRKRVRLVRDGSAGWASGAMLLVEREEFQRIGGFDPRYFLYVEDRDLSRRYRAAKLPIRATAALAGVHAVGRSSAADDLRPEPASWALLGLLEYIGRWHGEKAGRTAAWLTLALFRLQLHALGAVARLRAGRRRTARKRRQLEQIQVLLVARAFQNAGEAPASAATCLAARALLRSAAGRRPTGPR